MWKEHYKIGVEQIDQQHKQLIMTTEELLQGLKDGSVGRKESRQIMAFLKDYIRVHFSTEEMYQEAIGFSLRAEHKKIHEAFSEGLKEFEYKLIRADYDPALMQELAAMLTRWWVFHIMREDKKMLAEIPKKP
ncbi:hemerythrin family protein [Ruminococcaceae bacterium OttesenSCG-928-O06]|nr:hemerythrin family protein [Ruminococcaceae bacterium OttesenSCG-928-O06]